MYIYKYTAQESLNTREPRAELLCGLPPYVVIYVGVREPMDAGTLYST